MHDNNGTVGHSRIPHTIIDQYGERIGANALALLMILARHADENGQAFPSLTTLMKKTVLSKPTVVKAIQTLVDAGLVCITKREDSERGHISNLYTLTWIATPSKAAL